MNIRTADSIRIAENKDFAIFFLDGASYADFENIVELCETVGSFDVDSCDFLSSKEIFIRTQEAGNIDALPDKIKSDINQLSEIRNLASIEKVIFSVMTNRKKLSLDEVTTLVHSVSDSLFKGCKVYWSVSDDVSSVADGNVRATMLLC